MKLDILAEIVLNICLTYVLAPHMNEVYNDNEKPSSNLLQPYTKVYIEEEHHEVIPHWVNAVRERDWKKAYLVHIDGHSDMDYPEIVENMPLGHPPQSNEEISAMMQRNDQFIQSAIVAQLIETVYLIFPSWTSNETTANEVWIGISESIGSRQLCVCFNIEGEPCSKSNLNQSSRNFVPEVEATDCMRKWKYSLIELNSKNAAAILTYSSSYILPRDYQIPLILDIDEDFFGVSIVARDLTGVDMDMENILDLDAAVRSIFCSEDGVNDEKRIDSWFREFISVIDIYCLSINAQCMNINRNNSNMDACDSAIMRAKSKLFSMSPPIVCEDYKSAETSFVFLTILMLNSTHDQLNSLKKTGLCLEFAWRTHKIRPSTSLCLGHNYPGNSIIQEHVPDLHEFTALMRNFTQILRAFPRPPDIITVARSSRDGYVPRRLQPKIESLIVKIVKNVFNWTEENIFYSEYLAGGKIGWNLRI